MKNFLDKTASKAAGIGLICVGGVMAGLGLSVMALLAVFALAVLGLALLASPLVALIQPELPDANTQPQASASA